jgi:phosphatidylglycerol:prolipoprotein diacylglycerol transferase
MIPDTHTVPGGWGTPPTLFSIGPYAVSSYSFFVVLGLVAAIGLYFLNTRGRPVGNNGLVIAASALVGGILGSKIPIWIANLPQILADPSVGTVLSGRTIVGGIIGGWLAVWLVKRRLGIRARLGNYLVPSLALGIAIGRVGCFFAGCCYGTQTALPWGVDFGDQIARHPTQLYEAAFALLLFIIAQVTLERWAPGALFRAFLATYFAWRFAIEFIRVNPTLALGLTYYQIAAVGVVLFALLRLGLGSARREPA